jgi:hypothetical protein
MTEIMPFEVWKKKTYDRFRRRSPVLLALDAAIQTYHSEKGVTMVKNPLHQDNKVVWTPNPLYTGKKEPATPREAVAQAFDTWKKSKGSGFEWRKSVRNKLYAMDDLNMSLMGIKLTPFDVEADGGMNNARLGVLYLFKSMHVDPGIFNLLLDGGLSIAGNGLKLGGEGAAATNLGSVMIPGKALIQATAGNAITQATDGARTTTAFREWMEDLSAKVKKTLEDKFGSIDLSITAIKNLIKILVGAMAKEAAPFVSGAMDLAKGLAKMTDAIILSVRSYLKGAGVEMLSGAPSVIVDSIKRAMKMSIGEGVYESLKGAGGLAMSAASFGGATVVNIVLAAVETLVKFIWRLFEVSKMKKFFAQAKDYWDENRHNINKQADPPIYELAMDPEEFTEWYTDTALNTPAISILTLNSGLCGDKMRYLKMYTPESEDGAELSLDEDRRVDEFQRGVAFLDDLKDVGQDLLGKTGYSFTSSDPVIANVLKSMKRLGVQRNVIWDGVMKLATC